MIYRYIYMIVCTAGSWKNKFYIGQRTSKVHPSKDRYKGSGTLIKKYYKKYPNDYIKSIICYCDNQEQLDEREKECIAQCIGHPDCLNIAKGGLNYIGINAYTRMTPEQIKEHNKKISIALLGPSHPFRGKHLSIEHRKNISKNHRNISGINNPMYNKQPWNKGMKNEKRYKYMTDGNDTYYVSEDNWGEFIDIGYYFKSRNINNK